VFFMDVNLKIFVGCMPDKNNLSSFTMLNKIRFNG
jgi:hypothetical protein